ncbi:hypothetical protein AB0I81_38820 [Nonomuraea sp. NPDC050404]|uniref:hypothetical protein n=1 Tax=Nonomuraea sp. NPDC050404 TaxID=3155783 RepID=UPI0033D8B019
MNVSIPLVVVLGIVVLVAVRFLKLRLWMAAACAVFGFLLAATAFAPDINRAIKALLSWLTGS